MRQDVRLVSNLSKINKTCLILVVHNFDKFYVVSCCNEVQVSFMVNDEKKVVFVGIRTSFVFKIISSYNIDSIFFHQLLNQ